MTIRTWKLALAVLLGAAALVSCKKEEEEETLPSLSGLLRLNYRDFEYVDVSTEESRTVTFVPSGVSHPEGGSINYSYTVSPVESSSSSSSADDGSFKYTFPDSLGIYTVTCTAYATGYYSTSASYYATVVSETKSLTDLGIDELASITDARDGKTYKITDKWGNYSWFCQNLAYAGDGETVKGVPYRDAEVMGNIYGRFYTYSELENLCPEGWEVPSEEAWTDLAMAFSGATDGTAGGSGATDGTAGGSDEAGDATGEGDATKIDTPDYFAGLAGKLMTDACFNTVKMWELWPEVNITNESGLAVIPVGFANIYGSTHDFIGLLEYAAIWTSTQATDDTERAYYKYMICGIPDVLTGEGYKDSFAASVRCVKSKN